MFKRFIPFCFLLFFSCNSADKMLYKDPEAPIDSRVKDLLSRMTPEEKFWQLFMIPGDLENATPDQYKNGLFGFQVSAATSGSGDAAQQILTYNLAKEDAHSLAKKINGIQRYFMDSTRLGIPLLFFDEALHGLLRDGATSFPQAIGLAASFDTTIMRKVATAISAETKVRGIRQILTPVVNLANDVRWGRTEETYGEDPFLTAEMGVTFIDAFEKNGIVTTPKHFLANVGDGGRDSYPIHYSERFLEETHLIPFKAAFERGGSRSVMTAYNAINGEASTANEWLLNKKLKQEWGFKGFIITDAAATGGTYVLHNTAKDYPESAKQAMNSGLDVIFQTEYKHHELFDPHFYDGGIEQQRIDDAVARVLRVKFELGLFDAPYVDEAKAAAGMEHKPIARDAAQASMVLLKNEANVLPIAGTVKKLAVIGTDAEEARLGGYSGPGNGKVSILDGLKTRLDGKVAVQYVPGVSRKDNSWEVIAKDWLWQEKAGALIPGLKMELFDNISLQGSVVKEGVDEQINKMWTIGRPDVSLKHDFYSIRWSGVLKPSVNGTYKIGLDGNDGYRLYINEELMIDNWKKRTYSTTLVPITLVKDKMYKIRVEFYEPVGNAHIKLIWDKGENKEAAIAQAVQAARAADAVVVVAGIEEGEFRDRAMLTLPGQQEELIRQVAATGKPVTVVLIGGSAIVMNNWIDKVRGILLAWYPGEEGGYAVADVLLGNYNPAGRLPITFPVHEAQLPLVYNHQPTGRGDDYDNLSGRPLFPFGYGLSYTSFRYSDIRLEKTGIGRDETTKVFFKLKNTGERDGEEVVQLYIKDVLASLARPVLELKGFNRVMLKSGEERELSFEIKPAYLQMLNKSMQWVVEPGDFSIMIGASSADIKLRTILAVK